MAELIFKSAGVSTREIDLSFPTQVAPVGVPAGVIGTSNEGPAFVPVTIASFSEFQNVFGESDGEKFGPLAVNQWLRNAQSCTYIRVLGIGDGKKRNTTTGVVNRAGFTVGDQTIQANGNIGHNPFAVKGGNGMRHGRVHFLGCFMSESAGSTIFSSAGMQQDVSLTQAVAGFTAHQFLSGAIILTDTNGISKTYHFHTGTNAATVPATGSLPAGVLVKSDSQTAEQVAANFIACLADADGHGGSITGGNIGALAHFTQSVGGVFGNTGIQTFGTIVGTDGGVRTDELTHIDSAFASGSTSGGPIPILRGILLAPSGVILHLSGNRCANGNDPAREESATSGFTVFGRRGGITGSVDPKQNFTMILNGHKYTDEFPNFVTASFDTTSKSYFVDAFNTDPLKIEQAGHLLYAHYDIHSALATVTGSQIMNPTKFDKANIYSTATFDRQHDVAFLLTSSLARGTSPTSIIPNYEDFNNRFTTAVSPFVISQKFGTNKNLFRIHALSAGAAANTRFKISIENITKVNDTSYPTFDLIVRKFSDADEQRQVLETFRNINLNPSSDRYIGRAIGDLNVFFQFDKDELSQKINVTGNHPIRSNYIRVETSADLDNGNIDIQAIPCGIRGIKQVVTSGSILISNSDSTYSTSELFKRTLPPPVPFRQTIAVGVGSKKRANSNLYWGPQFNIVTSVTEPNKQSLFNDTFNTLVKHFPDHRLDGRNFAEASDSIGNNLFSLEHIKVRTGSDEKADPDQWLSASYVRNAATNIISSDSTLKTRAFSADDLEVPGNRRYAKFSFFLQGGFDGTNIFNVDQNKLNNNAIRREIDNESDLGGNKGPTAAAYRKAIDIMGSKSEVDIKLLAIPGIRVPAVTDFAISAVESRFDALYLMDIEKYNNAGNVITGSSEQVNVKNTVNNFKNRGLDSSFAAAYFPDVVIQDPTTRSSVVAPATVAVLGAFSLNDAIAHPWFAPAGFTRGALDAVESANVRLSRSNLDDLYDVDINPLTAFPGTGVLVWGQKTLLSNASALDRVNVRRLLINIRRSVRNIANTLLFEPNRQETLDKFNSLVNPILQRVQEQGGVDRYKVIIDTSTTTQADVENNTIRGKIFLQPTRAVEFIALDFVVTNAGANI